MKELEEAIEEFKEFVGTEIAYYDRGWEFLDDKIAQIVKLAQEHGAREQAEVDAKILERMTPEIPEDDNLAYVARATGIRHGLQMAVKAILSKKAEGAGNG